MGTVERWGHELAEDRRLLMLGLIAVLVRFAIVAVSAGSNDIFYWARLGGLVRDSGLSGAYEATTYANHPPLPMLYMGAARGVSDMTGYPFAWLAKLPAVYGDAAIGAMLWGSVRRWQGPIAGRRVALAYLFTPTPILLSAYHGNTDMLYVAFVFAATIAVANRRPGLAGLLFGAALNIKLLPAVTGVAFIAVLLKRGGTVRFAGATLLATAPIWMLLARSPQLIWDRIFAYQPAKPDTWGLVELERTARIASGSIPSADTLWYFNHGRWVLAGALIVAAAIAYRSDLDVFEAVTLASLTFLLATPGFGVQYLALPVALLFLVRIGLGLSYGWVAGIYLAASYAVTLVAVFPATSYFLEQRPRPVVAAGLAAWTVALWSAWRIATRNQDPVRADGRPKAPSDHEVTHAAAPDQGRSV